MILAHAGRVSALLIHPQIRDDGSTGQVFDPTAQILASEIWLDIPLNVLER